MHYKPGMRADHEIEEYMVFYMLSKGVAECGSRTKSGRGGVRPKAEKKKVTPHYFDGATDHFRHGNGQ